MTTCILGYEWISTVACNYMMLLPVLLIFKKHLIMYLWLLWDFAAAFGLSLVPASGGLLFAVVDGVPISVASLVAENRLLSAQALVVVHGLRRSMVCGILD